jgi:hypothetical protein
MSPWTSFSKRVLAAGAFATAVGAVIALGATMFSWFGHQEGTIASLRIASVTPLTYSEWLEHENIPRAGFSAAELATPGQMVAYDVETEGFSPSDEIPVRLILHDVTHGRSRDFETDAIHVENGATCGCAEWIPIPRGDVTYYLEVELYPPGPIKGQPVRHDVSRTFTGR